MASRLSSDALVRTYDKGIFNSPSSLNSRALRDESGLKLLDLKKTINDPKCKEIIKKTEPQVLYHTLLAYGPEECTEILPYITKEQFLRIFDYSVWQNGELEYEKAFKWLKLYKDIDAKQMVTRFQSLDEGYQAALLGPFVRIYDKETFEKMPEEIQDELHHFPGNELYYEIRTDSEEIYQGIQGLVEACFEEHMSYAMTLVAQAAFAPPLEAALLMKQFRDARLEEDGFVPEEEAQEIFLPLSKSFLISYFSDTTTSEEKSISLSEQNLFFDLILKDLITNQPELVENIQKDLAYIANAMCSATHIEAHDVAELKNLLFFTKNFLSFSLQYLSKNSTEKAKQILQKERLKTLFRCGITAIHDLRIKTLADLKNLLKEDSAKAENYFYEQKYGKLLDWFDQNLLDHFSFEEVETIKGLFNRFPLVQLHAADGKIKQQPISSLYDFNLLHDHIKKIHLKTLN